MDKKYLLSVLIPTKNREKYLIGSIEQILKIGDKRIQIVVQDNSDISVFDKLKKFIEKNENIKYNYTKGIVSFVDNFDIGLSLCDGEYICLIGDDDGIMPQIIPVIEWAKRNNKKVIRPSLNAYYFWPNSGARGNNLDDGYLRINYISKKIKKYNLSEEMNKLLSQGCQDYLLVGMAKLYHGIVKKECLDKIKNKTGKYFGGLTPDIYIATALSLVEDEMIEINFPLTVPGVCKGSGSSDAATGKHTGKLEDAPHFKGHKSYEWSKSIPKFYSVETIWADSSLAALNDFHKEGILNKFNLEFITLSCLIKHPKYKKIILENYKENIKKYNRKYIIIKNVSNFIFYNTKKLLKKIVKKEKIYYEGTGVENISEAVEKINKILIENNVEIESVLKNFK